MMIEYSHLPLISKLIHVFSSKLSMYQSLLLSMLNIVLHLHVLVQQKFQYKWHDVFHPCDCRGHSFHFYKTMFRCEHSSAPCHIRTRTFRCLQYYEHSIPFTTFKDDDVILRHITNKKISCLQLYYEQSIPFATFKTIVFLFVHVLPCHITNKEDIQ